LKSNITPKPGRSQQINALSNREKVLHCLKSFVPTLSPLYEQVMTDTFAKTIKRHLWPIFMSQKEVARRTSLSLKTVRRIIYELVSERVLLHRTIRRRHLGLWDMNCYFFVDRDDKYCFRYTTSIVVALGQLTAEQWADVDNRAVTVMHTVKRTFNALVARLKEHVKAKFPNSNWFKPKKITREDFTPQELQAGTFSLDDILASISP
jgi:DNA-binding Lrp family transcriptional regulator